MNTAKGLLLRYRIIGMVIIFCYCGLFICASQAQDRGGIDVFFQDMEIQDIFHTLAHLAGKNIIIHHAVEGRMSLDLQDVTFLKAMDFITRINQLAYYYEEGTFIIAPQEVIDTSFLRDEQKIFALKHIRAAKGRDILQPLFPDLRILMEEDSNQIIVRGSVVEMEKVQEIIDLIDIETPEEKQLYVVPISHSDPQVIVQILSSFLPDLMVQIEQTTRSLIVEATDQEFVRAERIIEGLDREMEIVEEVVDEPPEIDIIVVSLNHADIGNTQDIVAALFEDLQVEVDGDRNNLILMGEMNQLKQAGDLIKRLDQQKRQVLIEIQVEEISLSVQKELGIPTLSDLSFLRLDETGVGLDFPSMLRALQLQGASETLARPRLITIDGEEARLLIGDEIPYEIRTVEEGVPTTDLIFIDAGIILEFLPRISHDDTITLTINTEISSFFDLGRTLPLIATRRADTTIRVQDGESIIIGGLIRDEERESYNKIPFLGELPLLGKLFQRRLVEKDKSEIIIILTPHIIERTDKLSPIEQEVDFEYLEDPALEELD